jgi:hypothetical protein
MNLTEKVFLKHVGKVVEARVNEDWRNNKATDDYKKQRDEETLERKQFSKLWISNVLN